MRGDSGSDTDIFIVGVVDEDRLITALRETEEALRREINYVLFRKEEMEQRIVGGDPFIKNVLLEPKVMLIGND